MNLGEIIIFILVTLFFAGGIYGGIRLFRWNQRDREAIERRNQEKKGQATD